MPGADESQAFAALRERRDQLLRETFSGTRLSFKGTALSAFLGMMGNDVRALKTDIGLAKSGATSGPTFAKPDPIQIKTMPVIQQDVRSLIGTVVGNTSMPDAFNLCAQGVNGVLEKVNDVLEVLPPLAMISSAAQALWNFGKAIKNQWDKHAAEGAKFAVRAGDPRAAITAMGEVLSMLRNENLVKGSVNLTHAAVSAGGFFSGTAALTGPIGKAVKSAATLLHRTYLLARDVRVCFAATKELKTPEKLSRKVFGTAPILGCYLLTEVETSALVNILVCEIGEPGWMDKVEQYNKPLSELRQKAGQIIRDSRFDLVGLKTNRWSKEGLSTWQQLKARFGYNPLKKS
ncbi:MAG TPA: hypothetical protein VF950_13855 [Planctomycetota bacterium]